MSKDLLVLDSEFRTKVETLLKNCENEGYIMKPFFTVRDPFDQAKLWRQSRASEEVKQKIEELKSQGADFLAYCLDSVGPQSGRWTTNAIPGLSWHQWGEAVDCYWNLNGQAEWSLNILFNGKNGYRVYCDQAALLGLTSLGPSLSDWPHVQKRSQGSPSKIYSLQEIDKKMKEKFGN